ncbi:MAG TPA: SGNH/GDSL hydrolase family protein [Xanthobacteraceae bacterium]
MHRNAPVGSALLLAFVSLTAAATPLRAETTAPAPICAARPEAVRLEFPLSHTAMKLASGEPLTIVAVGSSSTAGAGATSPAASYPARLEAELKTRFPATPIRVINRGINGEEASQMVARFEQTVLAEKPDLVIWQVGTNAVLRDQTLSGEAPLLEDGVRRLKAHADVVLIDPQYAPKVLAKRDATGMVDLIGLTASREKVGVFHRFEIMRDWHEAQKIAFETVLSPDGLHMNDWSYGCVAKLLGGAIAEAVRSPAMARVPTRR